MNKKLIGFWDNLPTCIVALTVFLLPLFFVPAVYLDFLSTKVGMTSILLSVALFLWAIQALKANKFNFPFNWLSLSIISIPLTYLISAFFSGNIGVSVFGKDFGYDGVLVFISLFALLSLIISSYQNENKTIRLKSGLFVSISIVLVFNLVRIFLAGFIPTLGFFFESSSNTVGQWYDLGIIAGLGAILAIVSLELFDLNKKLRAALYALLMLSLVSLVIIGFNVIWVVLGLFSVIVFVYIFSLKKIQSKDAKPPVTSLVTFLIAFLFLIAGGQINSLVSQFLNVSFVEIRPSFDATTEVLVQSIKNNPIFGVGPTNFDQAWIAYKPAAFNMTELWGVDFRYGYSLMMSLFVMGGVLHILSWVAFFALYLFYGFRSLFSKGTGDISRYITLSSFIASLYLWIMNFVYVPSFVNLTLTFVLTGVFIASLYREKALKVKTIDITKSSKAGFFYIFGIVLLLLVMTTSIWHFTVRVISESNYRQGQIALNSGLVDQAEVDIFNSLIFYPTDLKIQQLTEIGLIRLTQVLNNESLTQEDRVSGFRNVLSGLISNMQLAIGYDSENYENYMLLGNVFEQLISYGIEGSYEEALAAYTRAREINQTDPSIVLALARLEFANENTESARGLIAEALELKGNYSDAVFLLSQIEVSEGNIDQAINTVEVASQVRPNDPIVFFQLGLLRYQDERFEGAVSAFENAVALNNNYDNAIYFLGLSYDQVGRTEESIAVFSLLNQKYPQDEGIMTILENLRAGDNPFESVVEEAEILEELPIEEEITE